MKILQKKTNFIITIHNRKFKGKRGRRRFSNDCRKLSKGNQSFGGIHLSDTKIDRLSHLMLFLKGEVESDEISLARNGFGGQIKKNTRKEDKFNEIPTTVGLFMGSTNDKSRKIYIFCDKPHYSDRCFNAKKMILPKRQKICER